MRLAACVLAPIAGLGCTVNNPTFDLSTESCNVAGRHGLGFDGCDDQRRSAHDLDGEREHRREQT
jgi:hypothetical protein